MRNIFGPTGSREDCYYRECNLTRKIFGIAPECFSGEKKHAKQSPFKIIGVGC